MGSLNIAYEELASRGVGGPARMPAEMDGRLRPALVLARKDGG
jgi:hypothetical protein